MSQCEAYLSPMSELRRRPTAAEWWKAFTSSFGKAARCTRAASFRSARGVLCSQCADRHVEAIMSDETVIGIIAKQSGTRPASLEEARRTMLIAIQ